MNRVWLRWIIPLVGMLAVAALLFAEDRGRIPLGHGITILALWAFVAIVFVVQAKRGRLMPPSPLERALPLGRLILAGAGFVLLSLAWLFYCLVFLQPKNAYTIMVPFFALLAAGLVLSGASLGLLTLKMLLDRWGNR